MVHHLQQQDNSATNSKAWVLGASGYTGAELCRLLSGHPGIELCAAYSSDAANSGPLTALYPALAGKVNVDLQAWSDSFIADANDIDMVFLALPHEVSHQLAAKFLQQGCCVFDLSAAFRLTNLNNYPLYYGFSHAHQALLQQRIYALTSGGMALASGDADSWQTNNLFSMPGCYPTAATLALQPLVAADLLLTEQMPVITAVSGASGAGRKASLQTSFCEVSLRPYNVLEHRHQCEIEQNLGRDVIFVPQLGNFKRGIVAICAAQLKAGVNQHDVDEVFAQSYTDSPSVRMRQVPPQIDDVAMTAFCDINVTVSGSRVVVVAALDNLLKGAASQAIEAANLKFAQPQMAGLL